MVPSPDAAAAARPASPTPSLSGASSSSSGATPPDGAAVAAERLAQVAGLARPPSTAALGGGGLGGGARLGPSVMPVDAASAAETGAAPPPPAGCALPGAGAPTPPGAPLPSTRFSLREFAYLCGPGLLMAVAYLDPGNLEADIQAGANVGYTLLWFFFAAFGAGFLFQCMTARLGIVTGRDLARLCGDAYPKPARILLWVLLEVALVGADIQETIGSALAISLLSGGRVPLWAGCILVSASAFLVLLLERCGARHLEAVFGGLIAMQGVSSAINYVQARVPQAAVFKGLFIPRLPAAAVPFAVGALGALIMPHNIYFASAIVNARSEAAARAVARAEKKAEREEAKAAKNIGKGGGGAPHAVPAAPAAVAKAGGEPAPPPSEITPAAAAAAAASPVPTPTTPTRPRRRRSSFSGGRHAHYPAAPVAGPGRTRLLLTYVRLETAGVLAVAFAINLFIVCLFAYGFYGTPEAATIGLESAGNYLGARFGVSFKYLWGIGLLASGQSSTISLTYAGQIVMAGLLRFEVSSWKRLIGTRAVSLVPTLAVAAAYEGARKFDGMNQLLNILQAMVLPFSLIPCIAMAASGALMTPAFKTGRLVMGLACGIAVAVACVDGYLLSSFFGDLVSGGGGSPVPPGAWAGFAALMCIYYGVMAYFAVGPRRVARGWRWFVGRARAACVCVREKSKNTRLMDPGAMMEVHF
jgi:Mn2+/Fe2+ NRAMP family transporter